MTNEKILEVGDEVCYIHEPITMRKWTTYTFRKVVRVTPKMAVIDNGDKLYRTPNEYGRYVALGGSRWELSTQELKNKDLELAYQNKIDRWFWAELPKLSQAEKQAIYEFYHQKKS